MSRRSSLPSGSYNTTGWTWIRSDARVDRIDPWPEARAQAAAEETAADDDCSGPKTDPQARLGVPNRCELVRSLGFQETPGSGAPRLPGLPARFDPPELRGRANQDRQSPS